MDFDSIISTKFIRGTIRSLEIAFFFKQSLYQIKKKSKDRQITLVCDNAPTHKTKFFLNYLDKYYIFVLFTPPNHPLLNPVEYVFRILKKNLRRHYYWSR